MFGPVLKATRASVVWFIFVTWHASYLPCLMFHTCLVSCCIRIMSHVWYLPRVASSRVVRSNMWRTDQTCHESPFLGHVSQATRAMRHRRFRGAWSIMSARQVVQGLLYWSDWSESNALTYLLTHLLTHLHTYYWLDWSESKALTYLLTHLLTHLHTYYWLTDTFTYLLTYLLLTCWHTCLLTYILTTG